MADPITDEDDIIIDETKLVEPDESEDETVENENDGADKFGFNEKELTMDGESVVDDEEFDEDRNDVYEPYEEDPSILEEDDDL